MEVTTGTSKDLEINFQSEQSKIIPPLKFQGVTPIPNTKQMQIKNYDMCWAPPIRKREQKMIFVENFWKNHIKFAHKFKSKTCVANQDPDNECYRRYFGGGNVQIER